MKHKKFKLVLIGLFLNMLIFFVILFLAKNILITVIVSIITGNSTIISFYFGYNVYQKKIISENYISELKED